MQVALVQLKPRKNQNDSFAAVEKLVVSANAQVFVLPELFSTGPLVEEAKRFAEPLDGRTARFLAGLARTKKTFVIGSLLEAAEKPKKTIVVFNQEGELISVYRAIHLSSLEGEPHFLGSGSDLPFFDVFTFRSAAIFGYDLRFPELAREFGLSWGFMLYVCGVEKNLDHWRTLLRARAIENQMFVIGANTAASAIYDPDGNEIARTDSSEGVFIGEVDPFKVEWYRLRHQRLTDAKKVEFTKTVAPSKLDLEN